jgi:hypothetical protein
MVAEADAVAVACAKELLEKAITTAAVANTLEMFFILVCFFKFECLLFDRYITNDVPKL